MVNSKKADKSKIELKISIFILIFILIAILVALIFIYLKFRKTSNISFFTFLMGYIWCRNEENQFRIDKVLNQSPTQEELEKSIDKGLKERDSNATAFDIEKESPKGSSRNNVREQLTQAKGKDEILKDEGVQEALRKIKDLVEKEKKNSSKRSTVKSRADNDDFVIEENKSKLKYKGDSLHINKKVSNTLMRESKKFEELNRDIKEILTEKRK